MKKTLIVLLACVMVSFAFMACSPAKSEPAASPSVGAEEPAVPEESAEATAEESAASEGGASDDSLEKIMANGKFLMGLDDSFPPMGFRDENGDLVGFDIDLARAVAEHMGIEVELVPIDWSTKELELDSGNIDVIWNGYTITDERKEKVLMSEPYMENMQVILVKEDSEIQALADLEGAKIAVQEGSSAQSLLTEDASMADLLASFDELVGFKDYVTALLDIDSGQAQGLAVDLVVADYYMAKKPGEYRILDETLAPEQYGIGFRKADQAFHDAMMQALKEMKEDGAAAAVSNVWFGRDVTMF